MTIHFHPEHHPPTITDFILCAFGVAVVSFFAGMMLRAAFNLIF